jgi:hypothetical protein
MQSLKTTGIAFLCYFLPFCKQAAPNLNRQSAPNFNRPNNTITHISYRGLSLDSIILDSTSTSLVGNICLSKNRIFFVDTRLSSLYEFNFSGKYVGRHIGHGNGPDELPIKRIQFCSTLPAGGFFIVGPTFDCYVFDSNYHRTDDFEMNWHKSTDDPDHLKNPDPNSTDPYSLAYIGGTFQIEKSTAYFSIFSQHRNFNPTVNGFALSTKVLASMNLNDGYVDNLIGMLSPVYQKAKNTSTFSYAYFELMPNQRFLIGYPADSHIYIASRDFQIRNVIGLPGREVCQNYSPVSNMIDFWRIWYKNTQEQGYYRAIKYVPERDLIFRSYQKSGHDAPDGLQIYKGDSLIADFDTPRGFDVSGYIEPWFYSNAFVDEERNQIKVYKFKLE